MDKELLESMNLDEDVKAPIELLIDNGFETIASCDGVLDHHKDITYELGKGYIAFAVTDKALDFVALMIDNGYEFANSNKNTKSSFELYGLTRTGNDITFQFKNHNQENSNKVLELTKGFIFENLAPSEKSKTFIHNLNKTLCKDDDIKDLSFTYLSNFALYEKKCPALIIRNKDNLEKNFDYDDLVNILRKNFNIEECAYKDLTTNSSEIRIAKTDVLLTLCFNENKKNEILDLINYLKNNEDKIKRI